MKPIPMIGNDPREHPQRSPRGQTVTRRGADPAGWMLLDSLIATFFMAILATVLHSFAMLSLNAVQVRQIADDLDETARIAVEILGRDLREVGYGRQLTGDRGLLRATADEIRLARDFDLDGSTGSSNERVAYLIDADGNQLYRQLGDAPPQPMVERIVANQSGFRFFAEGDTEMTTSELESSAARARVRYVEIILTLAPPLPLPQHAVLRPTRHLAVVTLRNHGGNP